MPGVLPKSRAFFIVIHTFMIHEPGSIFTSQSRLVKYMYFPALRYVHGCEPAPPLADLLFVRTGLPLFNSLILPLLATLYVSVLVSCTATPPTHLTLSPPDHLCFALHVYR